MSVLHLTKLIMEPKSTNKGIKLTQQCWCLISSTTVLMYACSIKSQYQLLPYYIAVRSKEQNGDITKENASRAIR